MKAELMNVFNENYTLEVKLYVSPQSLTELYAMNIWLEQNKMTAGMCVQVDATEIDSE